MWTIGSGMWHTISYMYQDDYMSTFMKWAKLLLTGLFTHFHQFITIRIHAVEDSLPVHRIVILSYNYCLLLFFIKAWGISRNSEFIKLNDTCNKIFIYFKNLFLIVKLKIEYSTIINIIKFLKSSKVVIMLLICSLFQRYIDLGEKN